MRSRDKVESMRITALVRALKALSPWKLQDCWCPENDHGGNKPHTETCRQVRAAIKYARPD